MQHMQIEQKPEEVMRIFELLKVVVLRAECMYVSDEIDYIGISPQFRELEVKQRIPVYILEISQICEKGGKPEIQRVEAKEL